MGRRRQAYKLEKRGNGIWYVVGTTPDGRRVHRLVLRDYPESKRAEERTRV
ncbi:MAG: hypothetical protein WBN10_06535 [Polyangiales bacterium]